jgi:valyl-tRNA synthetase
MNQNGQLINVPDEFMNMPRFLARKKVIKQLESLNLLKDIKDHEMKLPLCSRTGDVLEPMLKSQWFIKSNQLFNDSMKCVEEKQLKLTPKTKENLWSYYYNQFSKKDWCISR